MRLSTVLAGAAGLLMGLATQLGSVLLLCLGLGALLLAHLAALARRDGW